MAARPLSKHELQQFVSSLNSWELINLRQILRTQEHRIRLASLSDLPPEILILVSQYLKIPDVIACSQVSRQWHAAWTQHAVASFLCRRAFFGTVECKEAPRAETFRVLTAEFNAYKRRYLTPSLNRHHVTYWMDKRHGPSSSNGGLVGSQSGQHEQLPAPASLEEGTFVWQPESTYVVIQDMATGIWKTCGFASQVVSGWSLELQASSSELVVFSAAQTLQSSSAGCRKLQIWNIASEQWRTVSLPSLLAKCYIRKDAVVITTQNRQVYVWVWSGKLLEIPTARHNLMDVPPGSQSVLQGVPGVLFHPSRRDTIFLVWVYEGAKDAFAPYIVVVVKLYNNLPIARYQKNIRMSQEELLALQTRSEKVALHLELKCSKMNGHGLYCLAMLLTESFSSLDVRGILRQASWASLCFDTITETFHYRRYVRQVPSLASELINEMPNFSHTSQLRYDVTTWDDYLLVTAGKPHSGHTQKSDGPLMYCACDGAYMEALDTRSDNASGSGPSLVKSHNTEEPEASIAACKQMARGEIRRIFMDSDRIILATPSCFVHSSAKDTFPILQDGSRSDNSERKTDDSLVRSVLPQRIRWNSHVVKVVDIEKNYGCTL